MEDVVEVTSLMFLFLVGILKVTLYEELVVDVLFVGVMVVRVYSSETELVEIVLSSKVVWVVVLCVCSDLGCVIHRFYLPSLLENFAKMYPKPA